MTAATCISYVTCRSLAASQRAESSIHFIDGRDLHVELHRLRFGGIFASFLLLQHQEDKDTSRLMRAARLGVGVGGVKIVLTHFARASLMDVPLD